MNPARISIIAVLIAGILFTILLVNSQANQFKAPENDINQANINAGQLADNIASNISEIQQSMDSLTYNTFWQSAPVAEWSYWLESHKPIYQTAGLSLLGVHAASNNVLYMENPSRSGQFGDLNIAIKSLYQSKKTLTTIQLYKEQPALLILSPIKDIDGNILGSLVGIKLFDKESLKGYHHYAKIPAAITRNGALQGVSVETSPSLQDFQLVIVPWPVTITTKDWRLVLLVNKPEPVSMLHIYMVVGAILTLFLAWFTNKQISSNSKNVKSLEETLDIKLPIPEQISQLNALNNQTTDKGISELITSITSRLEQLVQQKKSLGIELRKSQEKGKELEVAASTLSSERDLAVAAPRVKSEFLSRMGDEITTPMKSVVSMLKLLSEYEFESEPKQLLNIAKRSTRTLVDNLNNILDFSKLDAQMLKLAPKNFSVRELVDDLSSELAHYANEKGLSLQASSDPEIPSQVRADLTRIRQILRNLLGNAIRFTKEGEVSLYVDMYEKNGIQRLRFTVKDSGVGIPAEAQKGLFDSLEQQTKLTNSSFAGRLRLIVSKNLAELMGGEIGVISEPGQGSQFWFTVQFDN